MTVRKGWEEVETKGDGGGEAGNSLGLGVPASKRGTITMGLGRKPLFHFRGRQSVRRRGRCGRRRLCRRLDDKQDKRRGREVDAPPLSHSLASDTVSGTQLL